MKLETIEETTKLIISAIEDEPQLIDEFLKLTKVEFSTEISTMAVKVLDDKIFLLINKDFVDKYCQTVEDLHFLFYHELYHLYFGHLFLDINCDNQVLLNVVFDAFVNSLLVKKLKDSKYISILFRTYKNDKIPECILRPPENYGSQNYKIPQQLPIIYKWVIEKLYYSKEGVSYNELIEILKKEEIFKNIEILNILLGSHPIHLPGIKDSNGLKDKQSKAKNENLKSQAEDLLDRLFKKIFKIGDNNNGIISLPEKGCSPESSYHGSTKTLISRPDREIVELLRKAMNRLLLSGEVLSPKFLLRKTNYDTKTIIPDLNEKTYIIKQDSGLDVIFYDTTSKILSLDKPEVYCNVYVDVSGSMREYYEEIYSALSPFAKQNIIKIFLWSTVVVQIKPEELLKGQIETSYGTEIGCVLKHVLQKKVKKALVLTDAIFFRPSESLIKQVLDKKIIIDMIIFKNNGSKALVGFDDFKDFIRKTYFINKN